MLFSLIHQYYIEHLDFLEDYMQQLEHYQYRFVDILSFVYLNLFDFHLKFVQYDKKSFVLYFLIVKGSHEYAKFKGIDSKGK